jgi:hypothetical protein
MTSRSVWTKGWPVATDPEDRLRFAKDPKRPDDLAPQAAKKWERYERDLGFPDEDPRRIRARAALQMLVEETAPPEPDFHPNPGGQQITYPVGEPPVEIGAGGTTRVVPGFDPEAVAQHAKDEERFASDVADIQLDFAEVARLRETTAATNDATVSRVFRERANELEARAIERREFLRSERTAWYERQGLPHHEAVDMVFEVDMPPRLGESKPPSDALAQVIASAKSGDMDSVLAAINGADNKTRHDIVNALGDHLGERALEDLSDRLETHLLGAE